jgi:hypothetical protein
VVTEAPASHAARLRNAFKARGDVDAVAEDITFLNDDIADVNSDADFDALVGRDIGITLCHSSLHIHRAAGSINDTAKLDQYSVAGTLDDPAVVLGDRRLQELPPVSVEPGEGPLLVGTHEPAIASHIGCQNGGKPPLHTLFGHAERLAQRSLWDSCEVDVNGIVPISVIPIQDRLKALDTSICEKDIKTAESCICLFGRSTQSCEIALIEARLTPARARGSDQPAGFCQFVSCSGNDIKRRTYRSGNIDAHDIRASAGKCDRGRASDPARGTGDDCSLAPQAAFAPVRYS